MILTPICVALEKSEKQLDLGPEAEAFFRLLPLLPGPGSVPREPRGFYKMASFKSVQSPDLFLLKLQNVCRTARGFELFIWGLMALLQTGPQITSIIRTHSVTRVLPLLAQVRNIFGEAVMEMELEVAALSG